MKIKHFLSIVCVVATAGYLAYAYAQIGGGGVSGPGPGVNKGTGGGGGGTPGGVNGQVQYNNSGSFGGLTNTQLTADINVFTAGLKGVVQASGGGTSSFLRADGAWSPFLTAGGSNNQIQYNNSGVLGGLTNTQLTADINTFTAGLSGATPASGGGTTNFLRADGSWVIPPSVGPGGSNTQVQYNNNGVFGGLTNTQLTADINTFTSSLKGATPASGGGTTNFLRADGTWTAPPPAGSSGQVQYNNAGAFGGLTNTQLTADINTFTSSLSGATPASGGGTTNFLRADGTWQTPAGGGNVSTSGTITTGNCAQWASATSILSTSTPCGSGTGSTFGDYINIKTYGATGDGTCHALSSIYATLAAAQAVYPFVSDLTQCIDWAATQQAINTAFSTAPLANGSFTAYCPNGNYQLSNPVFFDQANNSQGSYAAWASGTTYPNSANVTYNGIPWVSMGSGNVGNPPTSMGFYPSQLGIVNSGGSSIYPASFPWASVQISNGSPAVITPLLAGGTIAVYANQPVVFFTQQVANPNGGSAPALPTGINANQVYYVVGPSITGTTFEVSTTSGGSAVNTSSAGTGNFFVSGQVWQVAAMKNSPSFSNRVSFIGDQAIAGASGCQFTTQNDWTSPAIIIGPQNGNVIKYISVQGQVGPQPPDNAYKCTVPYSNNSNAGAQLGSAGFALVSNGGGSDRSLFEGISASGFYIGFWDGYTGSGTLADSNTFIKPQFYGNCIGLYMAETQAFSELVVDGLIQNNTTNIYASDQEGVKIVGGNYSQFFGLGAKFTISSVSTSASCGNGFIICVVATITSPDNNLQMPMCAYSAGSAYHQQVKWLNSWPFSGGCGYNTWVIPTAQWGLVGMYTMNYNPFTAQIVLGVPPAYAGIYQGNCCGSNFAAELAAATSIWAAEGDINFYGNNQVDSVHIENNNVPMTLSCFCTEAFGANRPAELKNVYLNSQITGGVILCCNQTFNNQITAQGYIANVIPFINSTNGDTILDYLSGGNNLCCAPTAQFNGVMDRALIATATSTYVEGRHMMGANNQNISTGSGGNNSFGVLFDFANSSMGTAFLNTVPLVNPGTIGQLSSGYYAMGGAAYGSGLWDNPANFVSSAAFSVNASNQPVNMADLWRSHGWGQSRYWGIRPEPASSPCILPSQATSLASLPTITYVSNLQDFLHVSAGGTGYTLGDTLTLTGGSGTAATVTVTGVSSGVITSVSIATPGAYTIEPTTFGATGGTGMSATFSLPVWYVNYTISYPLLWGGHIYHACNWNDADFGSHGGSTKYTIKSTHTGWTYGQNLTITNVPNLAWTMDGASPFIYMNQEALELMFPGLVFTLTGTGGCSSTYTGVVLETHPSAGYIKTVGASADGSAYVPALASSGTTCTGTTIGQASFALVYPY